MQREFFRRLGLRTVVSSLSFYFRDTIIDIKETEIELVTFNIIKVVLPDHSVWKSLKKSHFVTLQVSWATLLSIAEHYWALLSITEYYWALLSIIEHYWALLSITEHCWALLIITEHYWALLNITEYYWALLRITKNCRKPKIQMRHFLGDFHTLWIFNLHAKYSPNLDQQIWQMARARD